MKKKTTAARKGQNIDLLPQCLTVERLLKECVAALPHLPGQVKGRLETAVREFEQFAAPTLWSPRDVDAEFGLTEGEKREVISRFIDGYECKESDIIAISMIARGVRDERQPHVRVEYDPLYTGGKYKGTAQLAYVPLSLVNAFAKEYNNDLAECVEAAFSKWTKLDRMHIVRFCQETHYNQFGEVIS